MDEGVLLSFCFKLCCARLPASLSQLLQRFTHVKKPCSSPREPRTCTAKEVSHSWLPLYPCIFIPSSATHR
jgi:hypothetical protein